MLPSVIQTVVQAILVASGLLLLAYAVMFITSRHYGRALLSVASGLVLLATTYFILFPLMTDRENERLRQQLATSQAEEARARTDLAKARRDHAEIEAERAAVARRLEQAKITHSAQLVAIHTEIERTRVALTHRDSGLELATTSASLPSAAERHEQVIARARELAALRPIPQARAQPAPPPQQVQPPEHKADQIRGLMDLRERMAVKMSTPSYDVEVYPDRELVGGRRGRYYVIDLKNADSGVRFFFEGGRYTLNRADGDFRRSLNAFVLDILNKLEGNVRHDLYVRGSADRAPYEGRFEDGHLYRQIRYLRNAGGDRYTSDVGERQLGTVVRNQDLPDLRAMFLSRIVADAYPVNPPKILEGAVTAKTRNRDRNAELILFVDW